MATWHKTFFHLMWSTLWYGLATFIVLWAIVFGVIRLLLPYADHYKADAGNYVSNIIGQPVTVDSIDAEWHGWGPTLVFNEVALLDSAGEAPVLEFSKLRLGLDGVQSLLQWNLVFSHITLVGARLKIVRDAEQQISLSGMAAGTNASSAGLDPAIIDRFSDWFFTQGEIRLEDSTISLHDLTGRGRELSFAPVNMSLRNLPGRHLLDASLSLPRISASRLQVYVDMAGDPRQSVGRNTRLYLCGEKLKIQDLFDTRAVSGLDIDADSADFQLWAHWLDGDLKVVQGQVSGRDILLRRPGASATDTEQSQLALEGLSGKFLWQGDAQSWRLEAGEVELARNGRRWQPTRLSLNYDKPPQQDAHLNAAMNFLQLEDVSPIVQFFRLGDERLNQALLDLKPRGRVHDVRTTLTLSEVPEFNLYVRLQEAGVDAWALVPRSDAVTGQLWLEREAGFVKLDQARVTLSFDELFRGPIPIDSLQGNLAWYRNAQGWRLTGRELVSENHDIRGRGSLDVVKESAAASPFMSLIVALENGDGSQIPRYLPVGIMPQRTVDWLDNGIVQARLASGGALFHGRLNRFPFDDGDGRFEVRFQVADAQLRYAPDWPEITDIAAEVQFLGRGMTVNAWQGKIFSNAISEAHVHLPDMTQKPLPIEISGEVQGATQDKLDYLADSPPLWEKFGRYLENMKTLGDSRLHLDIELAIGRQVDNQINNHVAGWLDLQSNDISLAQTGSIASKVSGRLNFTEDILQADEIEADLFGEPARVSLATDADTPDRAIRLQAEGGFNAATMATRYTPGLSGHVEGVGRWRVGLSIPRRVNEHNSIVAQLQAETDLRGIELRLPSPFAKQAEEQRDTRLNMDFYRARPMQFHLQHGDILDTRVELGDGDKSVARADVRIRRGAARLPDGAGISLQAILDNVVFDEWLTLWQGTNNEVSAPSPAGSGLVAIPLRALDVSAQMVSIFGQQLAAVHLQGQHDGKALQLALQSDKVAGDITLPDDRSILPLVARLSHWQLDKPELGEERERLDPRRIPSLDIRVADFRYRDKQLGEMRFESTRVTEGLRIEQLLMHPKSTTMTLRGGWYVRAEGHQSSVHLNLNSSNIGRTLTSLGYVGGIAEGEGIVDAQLQWPDSLAAVSAENLDGEIKMQLSNGQVLDVDPGAGRLFSLLSLQALPRRLSLDFSDVFSKGFGFDEIEGSFRISNGNAYTNDFYMNGSAARIDIVGRVGLAAEDYDQVVTVTPKISGTLPVLGALAVTPQVGAVILFAQKLFKLEIDEATRSEYAITGPWADPKVTRLKRDPAGNHDS